jgi:hypothetical protein
MQHLWVLISALILVVIVGCTTASKMYDQEGPAGAFEQNRAVLNSELA